MSSIHSNHSFYGIKLLGNDMIEYMTSSVMDKKFGRKIYLEGNTKKFGRLMNGENTKKGGPKYFQIWEHLPKFSYDTFTKFWIIWESTSIVS
jgi:hypothetical protein